MKLQAGLGMGVKKFRTLFVFETKDAMDHFMNNGASLDLLGGARVWRVKMDFEFGAGILPAARIEGSRSWVLRPSKHKSPLRAMSFGPRSMCTSM